MVADAGQNAFQRRIDPHRRHRASARPPSPRARALRPWTTIATGFAAGLVVAVGCASSDMMLEKQRRLDEIDAASGSQCRIGFTDACYGGPEGTAGRGVCKPGQRTCRDDGTWDACKGEELPKRELCNRLDDDCDGIVDNGFERDGAICFRGKGACRSQGAWHCAEDGKKSQCSAKIVKPSTETCDGVDNDCDGEIDEADGELPKCSTGKTGVCGAGTQKCVAGSTRCVQDIQPGAEICNKLDDNCNGDIDEDCVSEAEARKQGLLKK